MNDVTAINKMLYRIAKLNRWYDGLERSHPILRFLLFMTFVGLPVLTSIEFVSPWFMLVSISLIGMRLWWLSSGAAALRAAAW